MMNDSQSLILHKFVKDSCRVILAAIREWHTRRLRCRSISAASVRK